MASKDPYAASLVITLLIFYSTAGMLACIAFRWPLTFVIGVVLFFLLIYGKLHTLLRYVLGFGRRL